MGRKDSIREIEQKLTEFLAADPAIIAGNVDVKVIDRSNFRLAGGEMQILVTPPAVLVGYLGGSHTSLTASVTNYRHDARLLVLAVAKNLRGVKAAKQGAAGKPGVLDLLDDLRAAMAGKDLTLPSGKVRIRLGEVSMEQAEEAQVAYGLEVAVPACYDNA